MAKWKEYLAEGLRYSAVDRLKEIKQPVLLISGEKDPEFKQNLRTLQQGLPNASAAFIPGVKHT